MNFKQQLIWKLIAQSLFKLMLLMLFLSIVSVFSRIQVAITFFGWGFGLSLIGWISMVIVGSALRIGKVEHIGD